MEMIAQIYALDSDIILLLLDFVGLCIIIKKWLRFKRRHVFVVSGDDFRSSFDIDLVDDEAEDDLEEVRHTEYSPRPTDVSIAIECAFEPSPDFRDLMYTIRVNMVNETYLLSKRHRDFGILFKEISRAQPETIQFKSHITTTGGYHIPGSPLDSKRLKWAKFDQFLKAFVEMEQWPQQLTKFLEKPNDYALDGTESIQENSVLSQLSSDHRQTFKLFLKQFDHSQIEKHLWPGDSVEKYCLRFLKARNFNLQNASTMLNADLKWRDEHNWKEKIHLTPSEITGLSNEMLEKYVPIWHQGFDKIGRPVSIQRFGAVRLPIVLAKTTLEKLAQFQALHSEHLVELCGERNVDNWVIIIDAGDWDPMNLMYRNAFKWAKNMNEIDAFHNPERLGQMFIVNAPSLVNKFYSMISYLLDEVTAKKIQLFSSQEEWGPVLSELIEADQLPPEFGGTGTHNLRREYGMV